MSLKTELKSGLIINFIARYSGVVIQIFILGILSRLLTPKEFGFVAVIMVFLTFFEMISSMGIGPAMIQDKSLSEEDNSIIFNTTIILGIVFGILFYYFSFIIAKFYQNDEYIKIAKYLSLIVFLSSINIVPLSLLKKGKEFKKIALIGVSANFISGLVAVYLAYKGMGYFVLIWRPILGSIYVFILTYKVSKLKFKFIFNIKPLKKIAGFSIFQSLSDILYYFTKNLDNILISKLIGIEALGFYDKAYKLMIYAVQNLTSVMNPVLLPVFSSYKNDKDLIYKSYSKLSKILTLFGMPLSVYLYFTAKEIIYIIFGNQWGQSVPIFQILALTVWMQMILISCGSIFQVSGRSDLLFLNGIVSSVFLVLGITYGLIKKNLIFLAYGVLVTFSVTILFNYFMMFKKIFKKKLTLFFKDLITPSLISIIVFICLYSVTNLFPIKNNYEFFAIKSLSALIGFLVGIYLTKEHKFIIQILLKK
jgi:PST family polysaccharide transporter